MAVGLLNPDPSTGFLPAPLARVRWRVLAVGVAVSLATAIAGVQGLNAQAADGAGYTLTVERARASLASAEAHGYTSDDLGPLVRAVSAPVPGRWALPWQRAASMRDAVTALNAAVAGLPRSEAVAMSRHRAVASGRLAEASVAVDAATTAGADAGEMAGIRAELASLTARLAAATDPLAADNVGRLAQRLATNARVASVTAEQERARLAPAAAALKIQFPTLDGLRSAGAAAVGPARDDATVAALLKLGSAQYLASRVEHFAGLIGADDVDRVALGVAGAQEIQQQAHAALVAGMPHEAILVSLAAQRLWAYEGGRLVQDTLVTTGRPELPTDIGAMKVLSKDSPWKMHSPWPKGSPHWYPDTTVRKVLWFTVTGEGLHDAAWQPVSTYGPGGQFTASASHGCVHVPDAAENFLYDWADIGTPVVVVPGDGTPVSSQLKQVSVDDAGVPLTGPKGS